jgi:ankyrin repeat protein
MSIPADSQANINLEQQRKRAKDLWRGHRDGSVEAAVRIIRYLPRARSLSITQLLASAFTLSEAQPELGRPVRQNVYRSAVRYGHRAAIESLRRRGVDDDGVTPVDRVIGACATGDGKTLHRLLEESQYSRSMLRDDDHRMLAWAIRGGRHQAIPLLLEAGLDPNVPDKDGETPLHLAVSESSPELVDTLLRAGADVDACNFEGQTPLETALGLPDAHVRERLTGRLLDAGAKPARMSQLAPRQYALSAENVGAEREDLDVRFERAADAVAFGDVDELRGV